MKDFKVMRKKGFKIEYLIALIFFSLSLNLFAKEKKIINVGYFVAPTFIFENDKKQIDGPVYHFFRSIEKISDYEFKFEKFPNSRLYHEMESGSVQMMAMSAKQLEKINILTSDIPYFEDKPYLVARTDFKYDKITSIKQLENLTIGIKQDAAISPFLLKHKDKLKFENSAATDSVYFALLKLVGKRVDLIHAYISHVFIYLAKKNNMENQIKLVELPGENSKVYFGFSKKLDKNDKQSINKLINYLLLVKKVNLTEQIKNWHD